MNDMIKLRHLIEQNIQSGIDTSKIRVKMQTINGLLVFIPFYDGVRMGSFRLRPYKDNWKIEATVLYDAFKGVGLGKGMYRYMMRKLAADGKKLYSDDRQSTEAHAVWQSLMRDGLATEIEPGKFMSTV